MINYIIKSLPANTSVDSVELECVNKRTDAINLAKKYQKLYYNDMIIVEKYNGMDYMNIVFNAYTGKYIK